MNNKQENKNIFTYPHGSFDDLTDYVKKLLDTSPCRLK